MADLAAAFSGALTSHDLLVPLGFPNVSFLLNMVIFSHTYFLKSNNLPLPLKTNGPQTLGTRFLRRFLSLVSSY